MKCCHCFKPLLRFWVVCYASTDEKNTQVVGDYLFILRWSLALSLRPKYRTVILARCRLCLPGSSHSPASASLVAQITGTRHHTQLIFVFLVKTRFHRVGQDGLDLLTSWSARLDLPKCWDYRCVPACLDCWAFLIFLLSFEVQVSTPRHDPCLKRDLWHTESTLKGCSLCTLCGFKSEGYILWLALSEVKWLDLQIILMKCAHKKRSDRKDRKRLWVRAVNWEIFACFLG